MTEHRAIAINKCRPWSSVFDRRGPAGCPEIGLTKPSNSDRTYHEHGRSFRSKGYQAEDGSGVGLLENVGKLNMMLRRKNACCLGRNRNRGQGAPTRANRGRGTDSFESPSLQRRVIRKRAGQAGGG